ncbi:hypothetical protein ACFVYJ_13325 [Pontibacter sp. JAM-7]|uniref:hypothetical protein n=1 Tax=Pontibacter sp. JAM-7 TaxID=3366581 RepID=UPI003AF96017
MRSYVLLLLTLFASTSLLAAESEQGTLAYLQGQWAHIKYELDKDARETAFKALVAEADTAAMTYAKSAEILIWDGIILSSYAGEKGGLGALKLVKQAKTLFETAIQYNPGALQGSAYTSLGSLYYQVPGWPIGFGSDKKARENLLQALTINPNGIDSNYFFGDFLLQQNEAEQARKVLQHALEAPPRPGRELADQGRRAEIGALLKTL